jgi:hypothetical protein
MTVKPSRLILNEAKSNESFEKNNDSLENKRMITVRMPITPLKSISSEIDVINDENKAPKSNTNETVTRKSQRNVIPKMMTLHKITQQTVDKANDNAQEKGMMKKNVQFDSNSDSEYHSHEDLEDEIFHFFQQAEKVAPVVSTVKYHTPITLNNMDHTISLDYDASLFDLLDGLDDRTL